MAEQMDMDLNGPVSWTKEELEDAKWRYVYGNGFSVRRLAEWDAWEKGLVAPARQPAAWDPDTKLWSRTEPDGSTTVVAGRDDMSELQPGANRGRSSCWACTSDHPHSREHHEAELVKLFRMTHTARESDDGKSATFTALDSQFADDVDGP